MLIVSHPTSQHVFPLRPPNQLAQPANSPIDPALRTPTPPPYPHLQCLSKFYTNIFLDNIQYIYQIRKKRNKKKSVIFRKKTSIVPNTPQETYMVLQLKQLYRVFVKYLISQLYKQNMQSCLRRFHTIFMISS